MLYGAVTNDLNNLVHQPASTHVSKNDQVSHEKGNSRCTRKRTTRMNTADVLQERSCPKFHEHRGPLCCCQYCVVREKGRNNSHHEDRKSLPSTRTVRTIRFASSRPSTSFPEQGSLCGPRRMGSTQEHT